MEPRHLTQRPFGRPGREPFASDPDGSSIGDSTSPAPSTRPRTSVCQYSTTPSRSWAGSSSTAPRSFSCGWPAPTWKGRHSFALRDFDPFWEAVQEADLLVGMHSTDQNYQRYLNDWEGTHDREMLPFGRGTSPGFQAMSSYKSAVIDGCPSITGPGLATRFPKLPFAPTEFVENWVRPFVKRAGEAHDRSRVLFDPDPLVVFRSNIFARVLREPNPREVADLVGSVRQHSVGL